jgi:N-acyl-D-aspartate/D-glutamate deacylase
VGRAARRLSHDNATAIGLLDRGLTRTGMKANLNMIDDHRLTLRTPEVAYDPPVCRHAFRSTVSNLSPDGMPRH